MGRLGSVLGVLALAGAAAVAGCDKGTATIQQRTVVYQSVEDDANRRTLTITSDQHYWNRKQEEVRARVEEFVNNGEHNVLSVKTFYSDAFLTSAEIQYSVADDCDDRGLRVEFIHSDESYWIRKQKEIRPRLYESVNKDKRDMVDANTVRLNGFLVAAEVYYTDE